MDIWTYFDQRARDLKEFSLGFSGDVWDSMGVETGSNDRRGKIFAAYHLAENSYLAVHEVVVVEGNHVHREEYGYFLIIDGDEVWGEERDPTHDPAVHRHLGAGHAREDAEPISFKEAVERAWNEVSAREEAGTTSETEG